MGATILLFAAAFACAWAAIVLLSGGLVIGPLVSRDPLRPLIAAAILATCGRVLSPSDFDTCLGRLIGPRDRWPVRVALVAAAATLVVAIAWNTRAAGGSDSSCYALQADALAHGHVTLPHPLAAALPDLPPAAFAPTGFVAAPGRPGDAVPICGPGLAMAMAGASVVFGKRAIFLVVPVFAALAVWATFLLGRSIADEITGAAAAVLLACSPVFLYQAVQPMSDVPAAALLTAAAVACARPDATGSLGAALLGAAAVFTRPSLAIAMIPLFAVARARSWFVLGALPCLAVFAAMNALRYGSPWVTGYGAAGSLFSVSHVTANLARYPRWLIGTETPFLLCAALASVSGWRDRRQARLAAGAALAAAAAALPYVFYTVFDDWWYLRFLLPGLPVLIVFAVRGALALAPGARRGGTAVLICAVLCPWYLHVARAAQTFDLQASESRFILTGRYAATRPADTVFLAEQESGSIRFHGSRPTIAWDAIPPGALDRTIAALSRAGWTPMIALDDAEEPGFRERFGGERYGRLDWRASAEVDAATRVRVYDPREAGR